MTGHVYTPAYVLVGQNRWNSFPEDVRQILEETAKETQAFVYENGERLDTELLDTIQAESDIEVNEADKDAFIAASDPIYEEFGSQVDGGKEMIDKAISLGRARNRPADPAAPPRTARSRARPAAPPRAPSRRRRGTP